MSAPMSLRISRRSLSDWFGRSKRHRDGTELHVVHVEDKRGSAEPA